MSPYKFFRNIETKSEGRMPVLSTCMALQLVLSFILGLWIDPGGETFTLSFTLVGCLALLIVVFTMPQANRFSIVTLCVAALIMTFGAWMNIRGYTHDDFTLINPDFSSHGVFDSWRETEYAKYMLSEHKLADASNGNNAYPLLVCGLFMLFGVNIIWPIALNMGFTLGTIALSGAICAKLMPEYGRRNMTMCGMVMATAISGILMHGTLLLKDAPVIFGVSLFAYSMALTIRHQFGTRAIVTAACASVVLLFSRPAVTIFMLVGIVLMIPTYIKHRHTIGQLYPAIYYALLVMAVLMASRSMIDTTPHFDAINGVNQNCLGGFLQLPTVQRYGQLLDGYYDWPLWHKLLWLPFMCAAQYFTPFPWNFTRDLWMGNFYWYAHISIGWYIVGGLIFGFFVLSWWRGFSLSRLNRWALWWIVCYIGIALYSAGSISRYYLPFVPAGIPLAAAIWHQVRNGMIPRSRFIVYSYIYIVLLGAGLVSAYIFLKL